MVLGNFRVGFDSLIVNNFGAGKSLKFRTCTLRYTVFPPGSRHPGVWCFVARMIAYSAVFRNFDRSDVKIISDIANLAQTPHAYSTDATILYIYWGVPAEFCWALTISCAFVSLTTDAQRRQSDRRLTHQHTYTVIYTPLRLQKLFLGFMFD